MNHVDCRCSDPTNHLKLCRIEQPPCDQQEGRRKIPKTSGDFSICQGLNSLWGWSSHFKIEMVAIRLMEEILHQLLGSLSHYLQGFIHPRWCRISSINSIHFSLVNWHHPTSGASASVGGGASGGGAASAVASASAASAAASASAATSGSLAFIKGYLAAHVDRVIVHQKLNGTLFPTDPVSK